MSDTYTKLLLHGDGTNLDTSITESSSGLIVTNPASYDTYTKLCSHFDGANAATAYTDPVAGAYTFVGTAQLSTAQKKFGTASLLLDGNSDYVTLPNSASWNFGTGDFTIDCWVYFNTIGIDQVIASQYADSDNYWEILINSANKLSMIFRTGASTKCYYTMTSAWSGLTVNTWHHLAFERTTTVAKIFINGVSQTLSETTAFGTNDVGNVAEVLRIGNVGGLPDTYMNGYIDELRISKGIARWTADFTPPVAPYGQVVISTVQKKFGTGSLLFDGSGSYLSLADSADWDFGAGDFTVDEWIRFNNLLGLHTIVSQWDAADSQRAFFLYYGGSADNNLHFNYTTGGTSATEVSKTVAWTPVVNTLYHVAVARNGNNLRFFVDGTQVGATQDVTGVTIHNSTLALIIGRHGSDSSQYYFNGYIDELRISKGVARWTSDFMLPLRAYDTLTPFNPICIGG